MANKQTLPGTIDTKRGFINTEVSPAMPTINWKSPLRDVAEVAQTGADFMKTYSKLRNEEYQAKYDNMANQMYHEIQDATDPAQLEDIKKRYDEAFNQPLDDTVWAKSYNNSQYKQQWIANMNLNYDKAFFQKMHEFTAIQMERTLNEMSSAAVQTNDPRAAASYFDAGMVNIGNEKHLTVEQKHKLQQWYAKDFVGKLTTQNPNFALSFAEMGQGALAKYGIDVNEIKTKADAYNLAMKRQQREEERYLETKAEKARKSVVAAAEAQIIQDPSKAEAIIAALPDNESFVTVSDWYRKGLGKDTSKTKSPLSQNLVEYVRQNGMESVNEWMSDNPEYINDSDARTAVNQALSQTQKENPDTSKEVKAELSKLTTKEKFDAYMADPEKATRAITYANETVNNLNKRYGIESTDYVDSYISDLNANKENLSVSDIRAERVKVKNNPLLSDADKNKVYKVLDSFQTSAEKGTAKEQKELSTQALNQVRLIENRGSEAIEQAIIDNIKDLNTEDMGKALELRNAALRYEGKESKEALKAADKKMQETLYTALLRDINENGYTDTDAISEMADKGLLTATQSGQLLKSIYDKQEKAAVLAEKDLITEAYLKIYDAEANNELPPTISELNTDNPQVIKERNRIANKVAKNRYIAERDIITGEIFNNPPMTREDADDYVARLSSLNYIGNDKSPEQEVQDIISKAQKIPEGNRKYIMDTLYSYMPAPLDGKKFSNYELNLRNQALEEVLKTLANDKIPDMVAIANKYKPSKEGLRNATMDADNAYYNLLTQNNSLFSKVEYSEKDKGTTIKRSSYTLNKQTKFSKFYDYIERLENSRNLLTDKQYGELYKPVALYMGDILQKAKTDDSIEAYAVNKLQEGIYGAGNPVDKPVEFYEAVRDVLVSAEAKYGDVQQAVNPWYGRNKKAVIDEIVKNYMQTTQQLNNYEGR